MAKSLNEQIAEAQARGDKKEVDRLTLGAGTISAATGLFTAIPDIGILGYNEITDSNVKDLRTRILERAGVPTKAPEGGSQLSYDLPEYAMLAWGLGALARQGWKGYKNLRENKKLMSFVDKELPPQQANRFKQFMMNGQGSDNPMVIAALQQLKKDPRYAELFTTMDKAATETALKAMSPRPSKLGPDAATAKAVTSVEDRINNVRKARDAAGNVNFTKAAALAGDRAIVNPSNTIQALGELRSRYDKVGTASAQKMVSAIDELSNTFVDAATGAPKNMTADQFKGLLTEFGRKVGTEDSVVKGLAQKDLEILNNSVFSSLSKDLTGSLKAATNTQDKQAIGALIQARTQYAKGSNEYNKLISQGIPKFLQSKSIDEIDPEMLYGEYKKLNPGQRSLFRDWVGSSSQEALQFLDKKAFDNFTSKAFKELPDGTMGYDLGTLAKNWQKLQKTSPDEADMLVKALGTNAQEFNGRMKDALVFSRKMDVGGIVQDAPKQSAFERAGKVLPAVIGSTPAGYSGAKQAALSLQAGDLMLAQKGLTSEQLMKALMTPEGASFLKQAAISPQSAKTLEALENLNKATVGDKTRAALAATVVGGQTARSMNQENLFVAPEGDGGFVDPEAEMVAPQGAPTQPMEADDGGFVDPDAAEPTSMPQATNIPVQGFEQQMPMGGISPEEEQAVMTVLQGMVAKDPSLNVDRVMQSYMQAEPAKRQQFMSLYGAQR
jgi:hypothetical protein